MSLIKISSLGPVHADERGAITDIINQEIHHIGYITFKEGAVRAKHYHKLSRQFDYIMSGEILLVVCKPDGSEREEHVLKPGDLTEIPAGVVHAYKALTHASMLDITTLSRADNGYEDDTVRVDIPV